MQVKVTHPTSTEAFITIIAAEPELKAVKDTVLARFQGQVKVPGFRAGKVPAAMLQKHVDQNLLQSEFLESALQQLYAQTIRAQKLRPVDNPKISVKKFVPFSTLEFEAAVAVVGNLKVADYKAIKLAPKPVSITAKEVTAVIKSLQERVAKKQDVDRAAKKGDQVYIDFKGTDAKGKPVSGADGTDYPLLLGSNKFIPGFETNIIGMTANQEKTFTLKFPADYGVKALASKKVTFGVTVTKIQEVINPEVNDEFAAQIGPFKSVDELKADIEKQLTMERQQETDRTYESEIIQAISAKSNMDIPRLLIDDQLDRMEREEKQNITYRGQTWEEHLKEEGVTAEQHRKQKAPEAEARLKASLLLAEIAEAEELQVMPEELEIRLQALKGQYKDPQMLAELDKPENRQEIAGRILTEKTLTRLRGYAGKK